MGAARGVLPAVAGEQVVALVTRGDRAVAVVQRADRQHARAIDLEHLTWGDALGTFRASMPRFALSPNGELLAMAIRPGVVAEIDLTTNKQTGLCTGGPPPQLPLALSSTT